MGNVTAKVAPSSTDTNIKELHRLSKYYFNKEKRETQLITKAMMEAKTAHARIHAENAAHHKRAAEFYLRMALQMEALAAQRPRRIRA
jgi:hypothetical protein